MSAKRIVSIHLHMTDRANAMLELLSEARAQDKARVAGELLEKALLGEGHSLQLAAERFASLGLLGNRREPRE